MNRLAMIIHRAPSLAVAALRGSTRVGRSCPFCHAQPVLFARRGWISRVFECPRCELLYGWPKQDTGFNDRFYQTDYTKAHNCFTTEMPPTGEIDTLAAGHFVSIGKNIDWVTGLLDMLAPAGSLLDYGCSWGYSLVQFRDAGHKVTGLEVCKERAEYGRVHFDLDIHESPGQLIASGVRFDFIYTSHVLEHLPDPGIALRLFERVAAPGCVLLIRVPNCDGENARNQGVKWGPFSSVIHPMSYRASFFMKNLPNHGFEVLLAASEPYDPTAYFQAIQGCAKVPDDGDDLVIIAKRIGR